VVAGSLREHLRQSSQVVRIVLKLKRIARGGQTFPMYSTRIKKFFRKKSTSKYLNLGCILVSIEI